MEGECNEEGGVMEDVLRFLFARMQLTEEEMWTFEEMVDDYIDKRIEKYLEPYEMKYRDRD